MRRPNLLLFALLLLSIVAFMAAPIAFAADAHDDHDSVIGGPHADFWKTANFIALGAIIAYMLRGKVAPFFEERNKSIAKGMTTAATREEEAQKRLDAVEAKLASLDTDIRDLKESARSEMERDRTRVEAETATALARIQEHTAREISTAGSVARAQLRQHAASLALELAEQQINTQANRPGMKDILQDRALHRLSQVRDASRN